MKPVLFAAVSILALSACNTTDPAAGGFFGGVGGLSSGAYDKRIDDRKTTLENEQDRNVALPRQSQRTKAEEADVAAQRAKLERRVAALNADLTGLRKQLDAARAAKTKSAADLDSLQRDIDSLSHSADMVAHDDFSSAAEKQQKLDQLAKRKAELEKALKSSAGG
jgi:chromosome segregation ATPase